jgi:hypothetical protein
MPLQHQRVLAIVLFFMACLALHSPYANARGVWYVSATAPPEGDGSQEHPFNSLAAVEAASAPGDFIKILRSPADTPPLEGGIALKDGQHLIGSGPPVTGVSEDEPRAKITNSDPNRHGGDAIVLADYNVVTNLHISNAHRAGVAAAGVKNPWIYGNLITGHNQGGFEGAVLSGFTLGETVVPEFPVGYGAIQITATGNQNMGVVYISQNVIRDAAGNGVLLNLAEDARAELVLRRNIFEDLTLGAGTLRPFRVVEAVLIESEGNAHITTRISYTSIDRIGSGTSNSDGIAFALDGSSVQHATIRGLTYRNTTGVGGISATGTELYIAQPSVGTQFDLRIKDADYRQMVSDGLQLSVLGREAWVSVRIADSVITESKGSGQIGGNAGNCLAVGNFGADNTIALEVKRSDLIGCSAMGVLVQNFGTLTDLWINVARSTLSWNALANFWTQMVGPIGNLAIRMEQNDVENDMAVNPDGAGIVLLDPGSNAMASAIDLGGGSLGSFGLNRIVGNATDARVENLVVVAEENWWGDPTGPQNLELLGTASVDFDPFLTVDPRP